MCVDAEWRRRALVDYIGGFEAGGLNQSRVGA